MAFRQYCHLFFLAFGALHLPGVPETAAQSPSPQIESQYNQTPLSGPKARIGEAVIALALPSLEIKTVVQEHLVFGNVLALLIMDTLPDLTAGRCRAVAAPSLYPNLRAYLFSDLRSKDDTNRLVECLLSLQEIVMQHQFKVEHIVRVTNELALRTERIKYSMKASAPMRLDLFLRAGLVQAYRPNTLMHILLAIDEFSYRDVKADAFFGWLTQLRRNDNVGLSTFKPAELPELARFGIHSIAASPTPPLSSISGDNPIRVRGISGAFPAVLAVRYSAPRFELKQLLVANKYCDRDIEIQGPIPTPKLHIGCFSENLFGVETWLALYIVEAPGKTLDTSRHSSLLLQLAKDPVFEEAIIAGRPGIVAPILFVSETE